MVTRTVTVPRITSVVAHPGSRAGAYYREGRAAGFPPHPSNNLRYFGGKTIPHLTFTNVYLGGKAAWNPDDMRRIDTGLSAAMSDARLNNVLAQYYDVKPTTTFKPSRILEGPLPNRVFRDTVEGFAAALDLSGFDLSSTVFCFMLPRGVALVDGTSKGHQRRRDVERENPVLAEHDEAVDSWHGLGGYHGSIHPKRGKTKETVYYAVGVYSEGRNGIVAFDQPWKSVCATFYHELCEARTDPDVEDAIRAGSSRKANSFLGWYSPRMGEIGDIPMEEAGANLAAVMKEVPLGGGGTAPIQLMWSNAVAAPEGPIARKHRAAPHS